MSGGVGNLPDYRGSDRSAWWWRWPYAELAWGDAAVGQGQGRGNHQPRLGGSGHVDGGEVPCLRGGGLLGEQALVDTGDSNRERPVAGGDEGRDQPLSVVIDV